MIRNWFIIEMARDTSMKQFEQGMETQEVYA
jgi:hypothetical protein